ncbi:MAG TPA: tripartite tricarboxylate transporter TctB family protein [Methylomirabilota bacterium]|nr:tripartite tricarboxylate transporter TctB family protein [Methylomirabilota bacterium]
MSPRPAARRDHWSALGLGVLALGYLLAGRRYPLDTLATPGPGIFPLAAGLALLALAVWQFVSAGRSAPDPADGGGVPRAPVIMSAVLVLYAAALPVLGFLLTSFALVIVAARLMGLDGWWRPAALALGVTAASRLLFGTWLGVPLP